MYTKPCLGVPLLIKNAVYGAQNNQKHFLSVCNFVNLRLHIKIVLS